MESVYAPTYQIIFYTVTVVSTVRLISDFQTLNILHNIITIYATARL